MFSNGSSKMDEKRILLDCLGNDKIRFATYIPKDSHFISIGRKIKILGPQEALRIAQYGEDAIPDLMELLYDDKRDWAANVILSSITGRDALILSVYADDYEKWKKTQKEKDVTYWKNRLEKDSSDGANDK
jgi:hypothetical protein